MNGRCLPGLHQQISATPCCQVANSGVLPPGLQPSLTHREQVVPESLLGH